MLALLLATALQASPVSAAQIQVELVPDQSTVGIRAYRLGVFPVDGQFTRFRGFLTYDPADHANCRVQLHVDVASLTMESPAMRQRTLGPDFLDAGRFPTLDFTGACDGKVLDGRLAMHGVTHRFVLALDWRPESIAAAGRLERADWGMTALPVLVGGMVRIAVSVHLAAPQHAGP